VRRLGRILEHQPGPGLFLGLPWGLDRVERVPVGRVRRVTVGQPLEKSPEDETTPPGQLLTGDHNLVNVQAEVFYTVDEGQVARFVLLMDRADAIVARTTESVLADWCAGRPVELVLGGGPTLLPGYLKERVQSRLEPYQLGVKIANASVRLAPPDEVKEAFERVNQAQTEVGTQLNQALQEADARARAAEGEIFRGKSQAAAYALEQYHQAQADAETFLTRLVQYRKLVARDSGYLNALWQDEMTRLYARMRTAGRIDVLDHFLSSEGLNLTQFPLLPKKK
jgi:membrane protease subunit HflK